jgi:endonuclease IV
MIGSQGLVVHPGSTKDAGWSLRSLDWLEEVMSRYEGTAELYLETMAGKTALGRLCADLVDLAEVDTRIGICVDLTHSWSAGLSITSLCALPGQIGNKLRVCHFNVPNQGVKCGSSIDRHNAGFHQTDWTYHEIERLWRAYRHVPCILEGTPSPERDYELLRSWT